LRSSFFFNLTRTLAKFAFQGAHKATTTNVSIREMLLFFPLSGSFLWVLVSLDSMTKKKKKNQHACIYFAGTNNVSHALRARKASVVIARVAVPVAP
jgi:hypothetical protein